MESDPKPFSDDWWELLRWFVPECKKRGMSVSLSDYTLGAPGQQSYMDAVLEKHPEFVGKRLHYEHGEVTVETVPCSANPLCKGLGEAVVNEFYGAFEREIPGECGSGINYFFSDELNFNIAGNLWCDDFAEEFRKRKGYDIMPRLRAIFEDTGTETPKIRLDYYDVIVQLSEEGYFKPVYDWHQQRRMTFGCDHGGRGQDVTEFGDYFRTMKWYQGPGNDQPHLESNVIKSKVSSSIAHLYERPRVWLEGFYSSGWGTSCADVADAVFRNFALGHNLLSLHGLYYSMHGSMWEWAPPCNHYHMPYWNEMGKVLACTKRLSWLLAQGHHACDITIVYPVAAMEADREQGTAAVETAFEMARLLYAESLDFDFIDFASIERAQTEEGSFCVAKERYRVVIVPNMRAVRFAMLSKLAEFARHGVQVLFLGEIPSESDRVGREDPLVTEAVAAIQAHCSSFVTAAELLQHLKRSLLPDIELSDCRNAFVQHRQMEGGELYYLYRIPKGTKCILRASGRPYRLDPWTAQKSELSYEITADGRICITMPLEERELLLVWIGEEPVLQTAVPLTVSEEKLSLTGEWQCRIEPTMDNSFGDYRLPAAKEMIGPQARRVRYCVTEEDCSGRNYDDTAWKQAYATYGNYFWFSDQVQDEKACIARAEPTAVFRPYSFSMRHGVWGDAGYQGSYHGLKGKVSDDFLVMGEKEITYAGSSSEYHGDGTYYFLTYLTVKKPEEAQILMGTKEPQAIWLDGEALLQSTVLLSAGVHRLLLKYVGGGRTHFLLRRKDAPAFTRTVPLCMRWYHDREIVPMSADPQAQGKTCWLRFTAPPGMQMLTLPLSCKAQVYADGIPMQHLADDIYCLRQGIAGPSRVAVCFCQTAQDQTAAALQDAVSFDCVTGKCHPDAPKGNNGLEFYSGGIRYIRTVTHHSGSSCLDLGKIDGSAVVSVNGKTVQTLVTPPYRCDLTQALRDGENRIEVLVHNTLYEHMQTIPTNFLKATRENAERR